MDRWRTDCRAAALVVGIVLMAQPAFAQTGGPSRPFLGLFGGSNPPGPSLHDLTLTMSLNGAADNGLAPAPSASGGPSPASFRRLYSSSAALSYALRGRQFGAGLTASGNLPYYPDTNEPISDNFGYGTSANLSFASHSTSVGAYGSYSYSPYYTAGLDPAAAPGPLARPFDYASLRNPNDQTAAGASLSQRFGRSTSAALAYAFNNVSFATAGNRSSAYLSASISTGRQLSRRVSVNGSYAFRDGYFSTELAPSANRSHDFDVGLGYNRPAPRGQSTTIDLSLGSSIVSRSLTDRVIWRGSAQASRIFTGGWIARAGFSRTLRFESVVQQPIVADVANVDIFGRFGRRVTPSLAGSYSNGQGVARGSQRFSIYSASVGLQVALASFAALDAQYLYYHYGFPTAYSLPPGVPSRMNRQRVQVGLSFWLPIVRVGSARGSGSPVSK